LTGRNSPERDGTAKGKVVCYKAKQRGPVMGDIGRMGRGQEDRCSTERITYTRKHWTWYERKEFRVHETLTYRKSPEKRKTFISIKKIIEKKEEQQRPRNLYSLGTREEYFTQTGRDEDEKKGAFYDNGSLCLHGAVSNSVRHSAKRRTTNVEG